MDVLIVTIYTFVTLIVFPVVGLLLMIFAIACFIEKGRVIREETKRRGK